MNLRAISKAAGDWFIKEAPSIMTGLSITSGALGFGSAIYETVDAVREWDFMEDPDFKDKAKLIFKHYAIPTGFALAAGGFAIAANHISLARYAALAAAYSISDGHFKEYKDAVLKTVGEKKNEDILKTQAQQSVNNYPPTQGQMVIIEGSGDILCQDARSKRYFHSTKNKIDAAVNELNKQINLEGRMTLNDFYELLDLETTRDGEIMGWDLAQYRDNLCVHYSFTGDPEGKPCLVIDYEVYRLPSWDE